MFKYAILRVGADGDSALIRFDYLTGRFGKSIPRTDPFANRHLDTRHLIELQPLGELGHGEGGGFRVPDRIPSVLQSRLNIVSRDLRVTALQGLPRFTSRQLVKNRGDRNPRTSDHRLATANTRIDFNSRHPGQNTRPATKPQGGDCARSGPVEVKTNDQRLFLFLGRVTLV